MLVLMTVEHREREVMSGRKRLQQLARFHIPRYNLIVTWVVHKQQMSTPAKQAKPRNDGGAGGSRDSGTARKRKSNKKDEVAVVTTILGAKRSEDTEESDQPPISTLSPSTATITKSRPSTGGAGSTSQAPNATSSGSSLSTPTKDKASSSARESRTSEPVQLLRPPSDFRDAGVSAVNVLDSRYELARDLGSIERALAGTNTVFRVVGALGTSSSGRSSTLTAVETTTKTVTENWFQPKSNGLDVFIHAERRYVLMDFPPVCTSSTKRNFEPPVFASQYRDLTRLYDLRITFTALVSCSVLFVCVTEESQASDPLFQLVKAASTIVSGRGWPCAHVVLVRNNVDPGQMLNMRRLQADERTLQVVMQADTQTAVVHVPKRSTTMDKDSLQADRQIARLALASFASRGVRVPLPNRIIARATESEWLSSLVYVFNETRTHPFFVSGEEVGWLR